MASAQPNYRQWVRRKVDFTVRLVFPTRGIREVNAAIFKLQDISEGGAGLYVGTIESVPDFFYMQFGDEHSELIACYSVGREHEVLRCQFSETVASWKIDEIIAQKAKVSLLDSLFESPADDLVIDLDALS